MPVSFATTTPLDKLVMALASIVQFVAVTLGVAATFNPTGKVSVAFTPLIASAFKF